MLDEKRAGEFFSIHRVTSNDAVEVAILAGQLISEIIKKTGVQSFDFNLEETISRVTHFIKREKYFAFVARNNSDEAVGFLSLHENHALYAEGAFGTISELYVLPKYRSNNIGFSLIARAKFFGIYQGWKRLEVTTPPLPQFDETLAFYEREGFTITGGRKLMMTL
ncbi:GNAT family N-acetyltransferase [Nitrincola alkalilacustris]|uniref:GNAT family N-acetyltransferase n=1 Tax=Nitrincola alkalilacustris TaxID=1571224 RepID=UPI00124CB311|nr:GNAT family N-acetyltransferase [Nitrincola alkalilacustris]